MSTKGWLFRAAMLGLLGFAAANAGAQSESSTEEAPIPPEQMIKFGADAIVEMRDAVKEVVKLLEIAEREKEDPRIQCLSKKLTTMRALLEVSESANASLVDAVKAGDLERAGHEFRKLRIALGKVRQFRSEADTCGGGTTGQEGSTDVQVLGSELEFEDSEDFGPEFDENLWQPPDVSQFE